MTCLKEFFFLQAVDIFEKKLSVGAKWIKSNEQDDVWLFQVWAGSRTKIHTEMGEGVARRILENLIKNCNKSKTQNGIPPWDFMPQKYVHPGLSAKIWPFSTV
jgi:hypothetical protein